MVLDKMHEECGVFGVFSKNKIDTFSLLQFGLIAVQHRGQEACGISFLHNRQIHSFKKEGLVIDAFASIDNPQLYQGNAAIGHTRYSTAGGQSKRNIQPLFTKNAAGDVFISIAHNGNLVNSDAIRQRLEGEGIQFAPRLHHLQLDNTVKDNKSKYEMAYLQNLVDCGVFEEITIHFFQVGHTHCHIDQLFSRIAIYLKVSLALYVHLLLSNI